MLSMVLSLHGVKGQCIEASRLSAELARSYKTMLNHIRTTTTDTVLPVVAIRSIRSTRTASSDADFASIVLEPRQNEPLRELHDFGPGLDHSESALFLRRP